MVFTVQKRLPSRTQMDKPMKILLKLILFLPRLQPRPTPLLPTPQLLLTQPPTLLLIPPKLTQLPQLLIPLLTLPQTQLNQLLLLPQPPHFNKIYKLLLLKVLVEFTPKLIQDIATP